MQAIVDDRLVIPESPATDSGDGRLVLTVDGDILPFSPERPDWPCDAAAALPCDIGATHFVGYYAGQAFYTCAVSGALASGVEPTGLRGYLGQVPDGFFRLLGRAVQLNHWYGEHRFCGGCGSRTEVVEREHAMRCAHCRKNYYPRLAPCVMALVVDGDRCLLARNARWKRDYFSTVAGFIEAGETVEDAVRREVMEEVGVRVDNLRYFASQPWPFPGQLMLGFFADYNGGAIRADGIEIAEAHWFDYNRLPPIPDSHTLSGQLIRAFVANQ